DRLDAGRREPVGALPAQLGTEAGAVLLQDAVERAAAQRPPGFRLQMRPTHGIVPPLPFQRARHDGAPRAMMAAEAADVGAPQVEGGLALEDPFGQGAAGAAAA